MKSSGGWEHRHRLLYLSSSGCAEQCRFALAHSEADHDESLNNRVYGASRMHQPIHKVWEEPHEGELKHYLEAGFNTINAGIHYPGTLTLLAGRALLPGEILMALDLKRDAARLVSIFNRLSPLTLPSVVGKGTAKRKLLRAASGVDPYYKIGALIKPHGFERHPALPSDARVVPPGSFLRKGGYEYPNISTHLAGHSLNGIRKIKELLCLLSTDAPGRCLRCGSTQVEVGPCVRCETLCYSCRACFAAGEARSCSPLFIFPPQAAKAPENASELIEEHAREKRVALHLDFELTPAQKAAYNAARDFVRQGRFSGTLGAAAAGTGSEAPNCHKALIHAVCGAGKTEAVFGAIRHVLSQGGRVLYATPRRDLVREQAQRFQKAFPSTTQLALYGKSPDKYGRAHLVLATTHQVMRFFRAFDLVVLDEVDAFPYKGCARLPLLVERAKKAGGKFIYITATPEEKLLRGGARGKIQRITIPARYHGCPAPEPVLIKCTHKWVFTAGSKNPKLPRPAALFVQRHLGQKPILVFVPTVNLVDRVVKRLQQALNSFYPAQRHGFSCTDWVIKGLSSRSPDRDAIKGALDEGNIHILVTTTVMERGVTLPGAQVLVLFAHHELFDHRTLVQIAGRVGRTASDPTGEVLFVADRVTREMQTARKMIRDLNGEAARLGYLKKS